MNFYHVNPPETWRHGGLILHVDSTDHCITSYCFYDSNVKNNLAYFLYAAVITVEDELHRLKIEHGERIDFLQLAFSDADE
nr:hypothetical protein HmN_000058100 [Hymenolepis microstoma]